MYCTTLVIRRVTINRCAVRTLFGSSKRCSRGAGVDKSIADLGDIWLVLKGDGLLLDCRSILLLYFHIVCGQEPVSLVWDQRSIAMMTVLLLKVP